MLNFLIFSVVAMDGTNCQKASVLSSFNSFDYTNLIIYIYSNRRSNLAQTLGAQLANFVNSVTNSQPSAFLTAWQQTIIATSILTTFKTITLQAGPTFTTPQLDTTSTPIVIPDTILVTLRGVKPISSGIIFAIAEAGTDISTPKYYQIRDKLNSNGLVVSGSNAIYTSGSAPDILIRGLTPNTNYNIYYYASNMDQSQYAEVTSVGVLQVKTDPIVSAMKLAAGGLSIIVAMFIFILL